MGMRSIITFILCFFGMVVLTIILGVIRNEYVVNWVSGNQAAAKVILLPVNVIYVCFFSYIIARHAISNNLNINLQCSYA
jgi:hypothetical protein